VVQDSTQVFRYLCTFLTASMRVVAMLSSAVAVVAYTCPGSPAFLHASSKQTTRVDVSCDAWLGELRARVDGQPSAWHDPHNNGVYSITGSGDAQVSLERVTGNKKYTDKIIFTYADATTGSGCIIEGCSESQVTSVFDSSGNFCNLRMLTCGSSDGCVSVGTDYQSTLTDDQQSRGASSAMSDCLVDAESMQSTAELSQPVPTNLSSSAGETNVVQVAQSIPSLSTFVSLLQSAQLDGTLNGRPHSWDTGIVYSVFAPTNEGFDKLPAGTIDALLLPENHDKLRDVLLYHVSGAQIALWDGSLVYGSCTRESGDYTYEEYALKGGALNICCINGKGKQCRGDKSCFCDMNDVQVSGYQCLHGCSPESENLMNVKEHKGSDNAQLYIIDGVLLPPGFEIALATII